MYDQNMWRVQPDDVIGGWCITPLEDKRTPAQGAVQIANFVTYEDAEHIVNVHNQNQMVVGLERPDWDVYFLAVAEVISWRADCSRRRVGAVIVRDHRIVATGYNGSPPGGPSCLKGECPRGQLSYDEVPAGSSYQNCIAVHAEANALMYCSREDRLGATLYINHDMCPDCTKLVAASGVARVVTPDSDIDLTRYVADI
jgi:dCMP deaminase